MKPANASESPGGFANEGIALARYTKGIAGVYLMMATVLVVVEVIEIRRAASAGTLYPMILTNLHLVGIVVRIASFLLLVLGFGYALLALANTTFSAWGIRRPSWLGGLAVPWSAVSQVTPYRYGLRFHTNGKVLIFPFRMLDTLPPELLEVLSEHVPRSALAEFGPNKPLT